MTYKSTLEEDMGIKDTGNDVRNSANYQDFVEEADYVLIQNEEGLFTLDKKPEGISVELVTDPYEFADNCGGAVLIVFSTGRFNRFNFKPIKPVEFEESEESGESGEVPSTPEGPTEED